MIYCDGNSGEGLLSAFHFECGELEPATNYILMIDGWNGDAGTAILGYDVSFDCDSAIFGCTDPEALNYSPDATEDDGTCVYEECEANSVTLIIETGSWAEEVSWNVVQDGTELYGDGVYENDSEYTYNLCLEDGCYNFEMFDSFGDGWNGGFFTIAMGDTIIVQGTLDFGEYGSVSFGINTEEDCGDDQIFGCTDPAAVNYNPNANVDDGSCLYLDTCQFIIESYFVTCSSYQFFAYSSSGEILNVGVWSINGEVIDTTSTTIFWEFQEPGLYEVCFAGVAAGCSDSWEEGCTTIYIDPECFEIDPEIYYTSSDSCTYTFSLLNADSLNNIVWYPGDGNGYEGGNEFTFTYESTGFYEVCASFETPQGTTEEACVELYAQSCEDDVFGCTDPEAINCNPDATLDDGSCEYEECEANSVTVVIETGTWAEEVSWNVVQDGTELYGDGIYENDSEYTYNLCLDDGCYVFEMFDSFGDGWNGGFFTIAMGDSIIVQGTLDFGEYGSVSFGINTEEDCVDDQILGCTDPTAVNYNPDATVDDGSCIYDSDCNGFEGTFSLSSNYEYSGWWEILNTETGEYVIGDSIPADVQYFSDFCLEDGCYNIQLNLFSDSEFNASVYVVVGGETVILEFLVAGEYNADFQVGVGCSDEIFGCTDPDAINYNPEATIDNGSCVYECTGVSAELIIESGFELSGYWSLINGETGEYLDYDTIQNALEFYELCLEDGCYELDLTLEANATANAFISLNGANEIFFSGEVQAGNYSFQFEIGSGCEDSEIYGCTDPEAVNYNPAATIDDGSCIYEFECNVGFAIIPDTTGLNTIWITPTFELDNLVDILWDFGDGTTSIEIFPVHEYAGDGPYTLCLTASLETEGTTCQSTFCAEISGEMLGSGLLSSGFSINVVPNSTLSVSQNTRDIDVDIFPNPASMGINLSYNSVSSGPELILIYDLTGKVIDEIPFNVTVGNNQKYIDIEHLANGIYILSLRNISNQRFVKSD